VISSETGEGVGHNARNHVMNIIRRIGVFAQNPYPKSSCITYAKDDVEIRGFIPAISTSSPRYQMGENAIIMRRIKV
jgi:hypothetical protein